MGPWRKPYTLRAVTIGYLLWSLLPVVIAVDLLVQRRALTDLLARFLAALVDADPTDALFNDPAMMQAMRQTFSLAILTVLIVVPLGTLFAIGIDRWHGRVPRTANFGMLMTFVVPEIILGVSLYILFTNLLRGLVPLGTPAQLLGLATFQLSYPVVIVRARLLGDRPGIRGGRDGPGRDARTVDPPGAPAPAHSGDHGERGARVRRRRRRLRHRRRALIGGEQRDPRPEDLRGLARLPHAGGERRGDDRC